MRTLSLLLSAWWIAPAAFASVDCQAGSSAPPSQSNACYCASTACGGCPQTSNASLSGSVTDPHSINVADFGARGDGAADDTAAIARALAAGTVVVFPRLTYVVTGIWVPSNRTLLFDGTTIKLAAGSNAYAFTLTGATNVRFAGVLKIDGNKSAQTLPQGGGMILSAASSANCFEYVEVVNPMEYGVAISASNDNTFGSLKVTYPGGAGIALNYQGAYLYLGGAADNKFYAIYGEGAAGNGVHLDSSTRNQFGLLQLRSGAERAWRSVTIPRTTRSRNPFSGPTETTARSWKPAPATIDFASSARRAIPAMAWSATATTTALSPWWQPAPLTEASVASACTSEEAATPFPRR